MSYLQTVVSIYTDPNRSERTFRKKLSEWGFKRERMSNNRNTDPATASTDRNARMVSTLPSGLIEFDRASQDHPLLFDPDMSFLDDSMNVDPQVNDFSNTIPAFGNNFTPPLRDEIFERTLQRLHEAPSDCPSKDILVSSEFYNKANSTLLHYVAARGCMSEMLIRILRFCSHNGFAIDRKDSMGCTALQVAVYYDRVENVVHLRTAGAQVDISNRSGELPIHVAVMRSRNTQLIEDLLVRHKDGVKMRVEPPSPRAGQVAIDLAVERVLLDLAQVADGGCTQATKSILSEVLKRGETLVNTTYLRVHAEKDKELFQQAIAVVSNVFLGRKLRRIMIDVLSDMNKQGRR